MDVYGLTGGIGSGKTTVAELLEDYGVPVVSADELSRIVVARGSDGLADVVTNFGREVLDDQGELDRRKMAAIVFQDPAKRRQLEAILHPRIRERFEQVLDALEKAGHEVAVYEVPLLFEKNLQGEMQAVILVTAAQAVRTRRVRARDDITETEIRARMAAQMDESLKRKRADYIIENDGTMDDLRREVEFMLDRFMRVGSRHAAAEAAAASPRAGSSTAAGSSANVNGDEFDEAESSAPSRVPTEIPSGAGLPVDGQPPAFVKPPPEPDPGLPDPIASKEKTLPPPTTAPAPVDGSSKTVPAGSTPTPTVAPGRSSRAATTPAPPPELQPTLPARAGSGGIPPQPISQKRTEGVPTDPPTPTRRTEGLNTTAPPPPQAAAETAAPSPVAEQHTPPTGAAVDVDLETARPGNPDAPEPLDYDPTGRTRRRKTMPASAFEKLRPPLPGASRPAPPGPTQPTTPNVPPVPTVAPEDVPPPPPPPVPTKADE